MLHRSFVKIRFDKLENYAWFLMLIILFFQSILHGLSILSNLALIFISLAQVKKLNLQSIHILSWVLMWLLILLCYSIFIGNQLSLAVRFGVILFFILSSYLWKADCRFFLKILFWSSFILVVSLFFLEAFMFSLSVEEASLLRDNFFIANKMGDVFYFNDLYYKLELRGTPLIVFVYLLSYSVDIFPQKYRWKLRVFYLVGVILAGNFAYQLIVIIYHLLSPIFRTNISRKSIVKKIVVRLLLVSLIGGFVIAWISGVLEQKSDHSMAPRVDQAEALIEDMTQNDYTVLFGTGVGHTLDIQTSERDYRGNTYFELQTLYLFNQLGLINFSLFLFSNIVLAFHKIKETELLFVYLMYLLYASTNPYIWDTNHIIVITALICARNNKQLTLKGNG